MNMSGMLAWRPLAVGAVVRGLVVGVAFYAATHLSISPFAPPPAPLAAETGAVAPTAQPAPQARKAPIAPPASTPAPQPPPAAAADSNLQPGVGGPVIGQVTAINRSPASFTDLTPGGEQDTYRVLDTTVFSAGRDRPYNFGLLKVGDEVRLRGRLHPPAAAGQQPGQAEPAGGRKPGQAPAGNEPDAVPVALFVVVRPAGEQRGLLGHAPGAGAGLKKG